ncbi:hypothetical protein DID88_005959 [Monilinia fructigena]|uniref:cysteine-S-conjugate beta-lyase n=1 Tax=Monilinia fructigena TaxID=38457 RepID=A0A395J6I6_9HELO|nr:hypothetical protein DID88_005959 [Monilinia fructigena]
MVLLETPTNPLIKIVDIATIAKTAHELNEKALVVVDNTMLSPMLCNPLDLGADVVYESGTKYLSGHHDIMAGVLAFNDPAIGDKMYFTINSTGCGLSPNDSFLLMRGIKTLAIRMERQQANAQAIAEFLESHGFRVRYPGLKSHPQYDLHWSMARGAGAVLSFETGDVALSERIVEAAKLWGIDAKTRKERQMPEDIIRLCVGIEDVTDLIDDLSRALVQAGAVKVTLDGFRATGSAEAIAEIPLAESDNAAAPISYHNDTNDQSIRLAAAGDNGAANAPKADDRERGRVHAGAISPIPLTLPAHRNHTRYSTNSASGQSRWHTGVPSCDNQAGTNRARGDATTRRTRKLREGCRSLRSQLSGRAKEKLAQEIQEGTLAYLNQYLLGTAAAKQPPKISYAGALKTPNTTAVGADPSLRRVALQKRAALPKQGREPEATGTQTVRPSTAGNPTRKSQREKTDLRIYARAEPGTLLVRDQPFLIREAITKAVPQISAKDIPRLWATPTGWAVKPNTKAVYDLILKGSNAALICKATRCTVLERVEKWYTYRLTHTPNVLTGLLDNRLVTADIVSKEAEIQTGVKPVNCHSTGTLGPTSMWYISFKEEPADVNNCGVATAKHQGAIGAACTAPPRCAGCHGPFPAGHKHCAAAPKRVDGKITRLTASQLGEIRRQQTATRRACELAAKRRQEQRPKDGVQVVIPTPGARVAAYEAAAPQPRRVKRKTAPTGSLNLAELSKRSVYAVSDDEASSIASESMELDTSPSSTISLC